MATGDARVFCTVPEDTTTVYRDSVPLPRYRWELGRMRFPKGSFTRPRLPLMLSSKSVREWSTSRPPIRVLAISFPRACE